MKALTIRQPYASLIVAGVKDVENRSWTSGHRGTVAIHAGRVDRVGPQASMAWHIATVLGLELPTGAILGVVDLVDVVEGASSPWALPGHRHWVLRGARPLDHPVPMRGHLNLWEVNDASIDRFGG